MDATVRPRPALPNTRLKLAAPVRTGSRSHRALRCASILFVNTSAWRRSLSAVR